MNRKFLVVLVACSSLSMEVAHAAPPDAGIDPGLQNRLLQQDGLRAQDRQTSVPSAPVVDAEVTESEETDDQGPTFTLMSVRFTHSDYLDQEQLRSAVSPWLGKSVSFQDVQAIVDAVNTLYRSKGVYTATAVLPKQRIVDGVVLIRLVEGKLGELKVEENQYTNGSYVRDWITQQDNAKIVDVNALEHDIQFYNRVNDQRLQAELRAGEAFGLTDIIVRVQEPERNQLQLFVDNYGYKTTGELELGALYRRQRLITDGDRGLLYTQLSQGTRALSGSYNLPVGRSGWRAGTSLAYTQTEVINGDFSIADITGDSLRLGLEASDIFWSSQKAWATLLLTASRLDSSTDIASGAPLSSNIIDTLQAGVQLNWLGTRWQVTLREMMSSLKIDDQLLSSGDASLLLHEGSLTTIYQVGQGFYGLFQGGWQMTGDKSVPGSATYSLGGVYTVRGYVPGIVSGDTGAYGQMELHYTGFQPKEQPLDIFLFHDIGRVKNTSGSQQLQSMGLGLNLTIDRKWSLDVVAGGAFKKVLPDQDSWTAFARLSRQVW